MKQARSSGRDRKGRAVHVTEQREIVLLERSPAPVTVVVFQAGTPGNVRAKWTATACPVAPPDW